MYSIKCGTCKTEYVGETQKKLGVMWKEQWDANRLGRTERSAVPEYVHGGAESHEVDLAKPSRHRQSPLETRKIDRSCRQALHIGIRKSGMNGDKSVEKSGIWDAIL